MISEDLIVLSELIGLLSMEVIEERKDEGYFVKYLKV